MTHGVINPSGSLSDTVTAGVIYGSNRLGPGVNNGLMRVIDRGLGTVTVLCIV